MSGVPQRFWGQPIRYLRWASHEKPAIFWSCVLGLMAPASFVVIPPLRRWAGDVDPPRIPLTYPGTYTPVLDGFDGGTGLLAWRRKVQVSREGEDGDNGRPSAGQRISLVFCLHVFGGGVTVTVQSITKRSSLTLVYSA